MLIAKKIVDILKWFKKRFSSNTIPQNPESTQARINSELELDKYRRDAALISEKISRRI